MTPESAIHAASTTKAVTAAATLLLVDRGKLGLDARVPELPAEEIWTGVPHAGEITVRQLLLHTSGLYSPNNNLVYLARYIGPERQEKPFWLPEEIVAFAADPANPPASTPNAGTHYSDINYVLLGLIVEAVSGEPLKEFVRREIFVPLGMESTYYLSDDPGTHAHAPTPWIPRSSDWARSSTVNRAPSASLTGTSTCGRTSTRVSKPKPSGATGASAGHSAPRVSLIDCRKPPDDD